MPLLDAGFEAATEELIDGYEHSYNDWDKNPVEQVFRARPKATTDNRTSFELRRKTIRRLVNAKGCMVSMTADDAPGVQLARVLISECHFEQIEADESKISEARRKVLGGKYHGDALAVYGGRLFPAELVVELTGFADIGAQVMSTLVQAGQWKLIHFREVTYANCYHSPIIDLRHPDDYAALIRLENFRGSKLIVQGHPKAVGRIEVIGTSPEIAFPRNPDGSRVECPVNRIMKCPTCGKDWQK